MERGDSEYTFPNGFLVSSEGIPYLDLLPSSRDS